MNRKRLQHLVTVLKRVPPGRLDMGSWACGTLACALGWGALDPEFNAQGLNLITNLCTPEPEFKGETGCMAGAKFFGIGYNQACELFLPTRYPDSRNITPQDVIDRVEELLCT